MSKEPRDVPMIDEGSGNVFTDVGLEMSEIDILKVHLALAINRTIQKRRLTQAEAGRKMGIDQSKVSKIVRGRLDDFSQERLIRFLLDLGRDVEIRVSERYKNERGQFRVRAC
jgi:predicted XRE-type DNA-binding protein